MRTNQDRRRSHLGVVAAAKTPDPAAHELRFDRAAPEQRGAHIQQDRAVGWQADERAELLTRSDRLAAEPLVVALRAGHDDAIGRHAVEANRFGLLSFVPHQHALRDIADERLARQVVPAADRERRPQSFGMRRAKHFELPRTKVYERRNQHDVRLELAQLLPDLIHRAAANARASAARGAHGCACLNR